MRVINHPILGKCQNNKKIIIYFNDKPLEALSSDTIASALLENGIKVCRYTRKNHEPRGLFCAIGRCNDCLMIVDGIPNIRTCVTIVRDGMRIKTQVGNGAWEGLDEEL